MSVELSASGMRIATEMPAVDGDLVEVTFRMDPLSESRASAITALARVVRALHPQTGRELALEFVELKSADEERLLQMVFRLREAALFARLGRRSFS